jgi:hypothetical protein
MKMRMFFQHSQEVLRLLAHGIRARAERPDQTRRLASQGLIQSSIPAAGSEEPTQAPSTTWLVWRTTTVVELDA